MAIDPKVFSQLVDELQTYYKREFTPFVQRVWYKHLSAQMTTEEFVNAIEQAIVSKQFMPTPDELVESVRGDSEVLALTDWELCLKAAARADRVMIQSLSPQGQSALHLIGGLNALGMATEDRLPWIKKEFVGVWKATKADTRALPQSRSPEAEVPQAVRSLAKKFSIDSNGKHSS